MTFILVHNINYNKNYIQATIVLYQNNNMIYYYYYLHSVLSNLHYICDM